MPWFRLIPLLAFTLTGCGRAPEPFPPPPQRTASEGRDPGEIGSFVRMDDPFAAAYIVRDITPEVSEWRWTLERPELKFRVHEAQGLSFVMEFSIADATFRETGPVNVSCFMNERLLGSMRCPRAGKFRFEKPVPEGWIAPGSTVTVRAEVDRHWVSKEDGARLGFLLSAAGFTR